MVVVHRLGFIVAVEPLTVIIIVDRIETVGYLETNLNFNCKKLEESVVLKSFIIKMNFIKKYRL